MSVSRNAHLLMRSPPHERFTYVALPTRFALTGRGLRTQHHITGKTTFRTGLPPRVVNDESHEQLRVHSRASGTRLSGLAQQRYAKSHKILANCRGVNDFWRFRNSQEQNSSAIELATLRNSQTSALRAICRS